MEMEKASYIYIMLIYLQKMLISLLFCISDGNSDWTSFEMVL